MIVFGVTMVLDFPFFFTKALFFLRVFHSSCLQEKLLQFAGTHWTSYNCHMLLAKKVKSEKCKVKKQSLELSHKISWKICVTCFCCAMWRNFVAGSRNSIKLFVQLEKSKIFILCKNWWATCKIFFFPARQAAQKLF